MKLKRLNVFWIQLILLILTFLPTKQSDRDKPNNAL